MGSDREKTDIQAQAGLLGRFGAEMLGKHGPIGLSLTQKTMIGTMHWTGHGKM